MVGLEHPVEMSSSVSVISLPGEQDVVIPGHNCTFTGWGEKQHNGDISNILQKVLLMMIKIQGSTAACQSTVSLSLSQFSKSAEILNLNQIWQSSIQKNFEHLNGFKFED